MRKLLGLLAGAAVVYGVTVFLLRADRAPAEPRREPPAAEAPADALDPFAGAARPAAPVVEEDPPPEEQPWGADAPARPNVRYLKVAGVPPPGAQRSETEAWEARVLDAAARSPGGSSLGSMSVLGGGGSGSAGRAPAYRGPGAAHPGEGEEETTPGAGHLAGRDARPGAAPRRPAGAPLAPGSAQALSSTGGGADALAAAKGEAAPAPGPEAVGWSPAAGLVREARGLSLGGKPADAATLALMNNPVGREFLAAQAVDSASRAALDKLAGQGRPVSEQEKFDAVAAAFRAQGIEPTDEEVRERVAAAQLPAMPPPAPREMYRFLEQNGLTQPPSAEDIRLAQQAAAARRTHPDADDPAPPRPSGPPPRNAREAYERVRDALEKGHRDFGVLPKHAFGIFGVESGFGRNTGRFNIMAVLRGEQADPNRGPAGRRQTANDIRAMYELERRDMLGGHSAASMRGSHGAAFGHTQFRPSSWLAYARDPDGGPGRDPYDMRTSVYSTANYLRGHGYSRDVDRAIYGYNHDWGYVRSVQNMASRVESTIIAPSRAQSR